jgi:membrane-associated phospholipid phosphatase
MDRNQEPARGSRNDHAMSRARLAGGALLFAVLAGIASFGVTNHLDRAVTMWLQRAAPLLDVPAVLFVLLGNAEVVIPAAALAGLALYRRDPERGRAALWLAAGLVLVSIVAVVLKSTIPYPGPPESLQRHILFRRGVSLYTPFSFPSGHTMRTTLIAGTVLRHRPVLAGLVVICMMAALVYLGDHWTADVLGGLCLGWAGVEVARGPVAEFMRRRRLRSRTIGTGE